MDSFTSKDILLAFIGSAGILGGVMTVISFIVGRIDKRRERIREERDLEVSHSVGIDRVRLDSATATEAALWKIIQELKESLAEEKRFATLTRPNVIKIAADVRAIRKEIESLNLMILNEEETNVFMRRFQTVKQLLDQIETILP